MTSCSGLTMISIAHACVGDRRKRNGGLVLRRGVVVEMGVRTFSRHFRETLGRAPHAFVIDRRVQRAKRLLSQGDLAIKEEPPPAALPIRLT